VLDVLTLHVVVLGGGLDNVSKHPEEHVALMSHHLLDFVLLPLAPLFAVHSLGLGACSQ
jgi:hypothetical protein